MNDGIQPDSANSPQGFLTEGIGAGLDDEPHVFIYLAQPAVMRPAGWHHNATLLGTGREETSWDDMFPALGWSPAPVTNLRMLYRFLLCHRNRNSFALMIRQTLPKARIIAAQVVRPAAGDGRARAHPSGQCLGERTGKMGPEGKGVEGSPGGLTAGPFHQRKGRGLWRDGGPFRSRQGVRPSSGQSVARRERRGGGGFLGQGHSPGLSNWQGVIFGPP